MQRRHLLGAVVVAAVLAVSALSSPTHADALRHLRLLRAFPAKDTTLTSAPDAVRLWLSEPADLAATKITVTREGGGAVPTAAPTRGEARDAPIVATFPTPPGSGRYTVDWRAMSKDGHVVKGTHGFTVRIAD